MDNMMGPDFEKGLSNMKREIESMPEETAKAKYEVHEQNWEPVTYVGKKETVMFEKLPEFFGKNYPAIMTELGKGKVEPQSAPSAIFTKYDEKEGKAEVAAVMKVPAGTKAKGWETFSFPASKVLHIAYYGDYAKSMEAHMQMDSYIKERGLKQGVVVEEYVTDPMSEKDTTKWLTNIYYMVQ
jgi:effector-binding domain-containing protein